MNLFLTFAIFPYVEYYLTFHVENGLLCAFCVSDLLPLTWENIFSQIAGPRVWQAGSYVNVKNVEETVDTSYQMIKVFQQNVCLCLREANFMLLSRIELVFIFCSHKILPVNCSNHYTY